MKQVVVLSRDLAESISDILHRMEVEGFEITEAEDEAWQAFTVAILNAVEVEFKQH